MEEVNDYILIKSLGKGSFGEVYLTQKKNNPKLFAMKKIPKKNLIILSVAFFFNYKKRENKNLIYIKKCSKFKIMF